MSADMSTIKAFHEFLGEQLAQGREFESLEDSLEAFRKYECELAAARAAIRPALDRAIRGEPGVRFDPDEIISRGQERLRNRN